MKSLPEISLVWIAALLALAITYFGTRPDRSMVADIESPARSATAESSTP